MLSLLAVPLLTAVTVRADQTPLLAACSADAEIVGTLPAGQIVEIRSAIAGETTCYKVYAIVDGRAVSGWVAPHDLSGADQFERVRQAGSDPAGAIRMVTSRVDGIRERAGSAVPATLEVRAALDAIDQNEPARALSLLQPVLRNRNDPNLLALAGVAAWRNDEPQAAIDYWKRSLGIRGDPELENLCRTVERETAADRSSGRAYGLRVLLRYEPKVVSPELARDMVLALDHEWMRVSGQLGCVARERVLAVVQSREAYLATTGAAEWSGGRYDGRIRVALVDEGSVGPGTQRVFSHEIVHACLANLGRWPHWLHEGLAQKISGDRLTPESVARVREVIRDRKLAGLEDLGNRDIMTSLNARDIYAVALYAADVLMNDYDGMGIRNVLSNPALLSQITGELNRKLGFLN